MKKDVFYRVAKGDFILDKQTPFCKNQVLEINLYLVFTIVIKFLFPVTIDSFVANLIMEKLWEAIEPHLARTVTFFPLNIKTK